MQFNLGGAKADSLTAFSVLRARQMDWGKGFRCGWRQYKQLVSTHLDIAGAAMASHSQLRICCAAIMKSKNSVA